jgi:hypothetical protein
MTTDVNNGALNTYIGPAGGDVDASYFILRYPSTLQFSLKAGVAYVQWNDDPNAAVPIPRDADQAKPVRNFTATNGSLFKIDKLFYPLNF